MFNVFTYEKKENEKREKAKSESKEKFKSIKKSIFQLDNRYC